MENKTPTVYMFVGLPASGKTTLAYRLAEERDILLLDSDEVRLKYLGDKEYDPADNDYVFNIIHTEIKKSLKNNQDCAIVATNCSEKKRRHFLTHILKGIECKKKKYFSCYSI